MRGTVLKSLFAAVLLAVAAPMAGVVPAQAAQAEAIFAGGCFWCMEPPYDKTGGVISTTSGYIGGGTANPTYRQVSSGGTGHIEAVKVVYDPDRVSYDKLLDIFWRNVDPFDGGGQFCDRGSQYRSAIFYTGGAQKAAAQASKAAVEARFGKSVATAVRRAGRFYPAEDYHQNYYRKNPVKYRYYRSHCGRDSRLAEVWN
ncbi:peptide-methionine (S)-S-oxide reductase MsrA [Microbaculum marinisediminis]|uniref:Peptide methionine sulfoxide reductase MsrA n=1 Tax=Microbaculum marinisediminis TaxID=2931392 RepID=A0AAW5QT58_9HYPH|nr:peptide-methionine (S)-S-oxide reductase MsrA [Microbaculum sp. A6E488]MCT8971145.1 peptide-methionine (S)-S-oxide reductase MsrA [Microbaculum sp. A6E488]